MGAEQLELALRKNNGISHADLTIPAYELLVANLKKHGNKLSEEHAASLMALCGLFTKHAQGELQGRWAFALPTGMGKTSAVIAWCALLAKMGPAGKHIGVSVAASKVEALCDLKRELIHQGVPEEDIGLLHSYKHDPEKARRGVDGYATEPRTDDNDERQIMLVTHQRIKGNPADLVRFNTYRGHPRALVIWDEALMVSESVGMSVQDLRGALGWLQGVDLRLKLTRDLHLILTRRSGRIMA